MIPQIFDTRKRNLFKKRAYDNFQNHDFLHKEIFLNHLDRLSMILQDMPQVTLIDVPHYFTKMPEAEVFFAHKKTSNIISFQREDEIIPSSLNNQDAIIALLTCHSVNDLVGYFIQIKKALKPDGIFIGSFIGPNALFLVKNAFANAELEARNACEKRFFPTIDIRDLGGLLQRANFALPVADTESFRVHYKNLSSLVNDIRGTGERNYLSDRPQTLTKSIYINALKNLQEQLADHILDIDIITVTGRSPSEAQQKPLKPGSAQISMTEILK